MIQELTKIFGKEEQPKKKKEEEAGLCLRFLSQPCQQMTHSISPWRSEGWGRREGHSITWEPFFYPEGTIMSGIVCSIPYHNGQKVPAVVPGTE